jgi:hypothetical protein
MIHSLHLLGWYKPIVFHYTDAMWDPTMAANPGQGIVQ